MSANTETQTVKLQRIADASRWVYLEKCPLCSSLDFRLIEIHREKLGLCKCAACRVIFLNPRPSSLGYTANHIQASYLPRSIKNNLISADLVPNTKQIYAKYRKIADLAAEVSKNEIVADVGCGIGFSMLALKHIGIESIGLEIDEAFIKFASGQFGLNVRFHNVFEDQLLPRVRVATLSSVLEHLPNPINFLKAIRKNVLDSYGFLIITVPNILSLEYIRDGEKWHNINGGHLFYFSEETLIQVAAQAGFDVVKIYRESRIFQDELRTSQIYLQDLLGLDFNLSGGIGIIFRSTD